MSYWHYRQSNGIIGVFKGMQERLINEVGIPKERTLYIPQAPEKIYEKSINDESLQKRFKDTFNIIFAGNINPAQCFDVITAAAKIVHEKGPTNIRYIIIGDGMSKKWLESEVDRLGLGEQFVFEGLKPVNDIPKYQSIADATIVALSKSPLFEYGIPAKVYSYMPAGKPIIASMDGEGKRLINDMAKCGVCVDSGDIKGLANAILHVSTLPTKKRDALGFNGKKYYFKHFEREHNLDRLEQFVFNNIQIIDNEYPNA
jgi:glycosyltransferase involved in cell wall biosynthesis